MIPAFFEVLKDLWFFVFGKALSGETGREVVPVGLLPAGDGADPFPTAGRKSQKLFAPSYAPNISEGRPTYIAADNVVCLQRPALAFDTVVGFLFYGDVVQAGDAGGVFTHIRTSEFCGWVRSEALASGAEQVLVSLADNRVYGAKESETIKLRRFIKDETLGGELGLPLQPIEFILYTLKKTGVSICWPAERPRTPGTWRIILKGIAGVTVGTVPRTAAVLESAGDGEQPGILAYVQEVRPDNSIKISSVGRVKEGEFRVEELTQAEWQVWQPVFISFT